jgi:mannosyl-3-phosphoglycerate phosphatase
VSRLHRPEPPFLVFTDLDGTLLDEHYDHGPARPALERLRRRVIPLVLTSSKTLAEMRALRATLDLAHPVIFENGAGIAVPPGYFEGEGGPGLEVETFGPGYAELREILDDLRERRGYPFRGFGDMGNAEVARLTGLDELSAARARQRIGSEPGIWEGSEAVRQDFIRDIASEGLRAMRGGRFLHVMPKVDKATAVAALVERYTAAWGKAPVVIAAGDSPNDADMLLAADEAVVIRRPDGTWMPVKRRQGLHRSPQIGPEGWRHCIDEILDAADAADPDGAQR